MFEDEKILLPEYPRTRHLPWKPNAARDDLVATEAEAQVIFNCESVCVEEKVDGANLGMAKGAIIRNRNFILRKGYTARTPAKLQFAPVWNWYYEHEDCFDELEKIAGPVSVYGEWLLALHSVAYDWLPSYFMAFDLYDYHAGKFMNPKLGRGILAAAGFSLVPELHHGRIESYTQLESLTLDHSALAATGRREGVYIKVSDGDWVTHRFKMVRQGFVPGEHFHKKGAIVKNRLAKS